jgi:hypothetical protein
MLHTRRRSCLVLSCWWLFTESRAMGSERPTWTFHHVQTPVVHVYVYRKTLQANEQQYIVVFNATHARRCSHSLRILTGCHSHPALNASRTTQRRRELHALYSLDYWDVELVEDEQWGRVLVAQRDFAPGEIVVRSGVLLSTESVADCVRQYHKFHHQANGAHIMAQYLHWATSSPRCAA